MSHVILSLTGFITLANAAILCLIWQDICILKNDMFVDPEQQGEKQFGVLRYTSKRCAYELQDHMNTCGIQTHKGSPFQAYLPDPLLLVSPSNPRLGGFH